MVTRRRSVVGGDSAGVVAAPSPKDVARRTSARCATPSEVADAIGAATAGREASARREGTAESPAFGSPVVVRFPLLAPVVSSLMFADVVVPRRPPPLRVAGASSSGVVHRGFAVINDALNLRRGGDSALLLPVSLGGPPPPPVAVAAVVEVVELNRCRGAVARAGAAGRAAMTASGLGSELVDAERERLLMVLFALLAAFEAPSTLAAAADAARWRGRRCWGWTFSDDGGARGTRGSGGGDRGAGPGGMAPSPVMSEPSWYIDK